MILTFISSLECLSFALDRRIGFDTLVIVLQINSLREAFYIQLLY